MIRDQDLQRAGRRIVEVQTPRHPQCQFRADLGVPAVALRFVTEAADLRGADLVILPGTKSTLADLHWLRGGGLAAEVTRHRPSR